MKIVLKSLQLHFRESVETIEFEHVNFFWGKIGAGKSSIARLVDFCLGADISLTPALQLEFLQAVLSIEVEGRRLTIYRERGSTSVVAVWGEGAEALEVFLPARKANGIAVPGTEIEVLSDLIFYLADLSPPKVRKGRQTAEPSLVRLSFRDLFRFCYIDQDEIDSDFYRLDLEGDWARRAKSVDAMRFIFGYHQDHVAVLEAQLQVMHEEKMTARAAAEALNKVLEEAGFSHPNEIDSRIESLRAMREMVRVQSTHLRLTAQPIGVPYSGGGESTSLAVSDSGKFRPGQYDTGQIISSDGVVDNGPVVHAVDILREKGRTLSSELKSLEDMSAAVRQRTEDTERHLNELKMLSVRFSRTKSARSILASVDFEECPRCTQTLPTRDGTLCMVCGQPERSHPHEHMSNGVVEADLKSRLGELQETLQGLKQQGKRILRELESSKAEKSMVDRVLAQRLREYDSAVMSRALEFEREASSIEQQINSLLSYRKLPERLMELLSTAEALNGQEIELRAKLNRARESAFKDRSNLDSFEVLFLDCLVRSAFPGITRTFKVFIDPKTFVPEVFPSEEADFAVTSFANMGSGGMKTIFKACYALAVHRLAAKSGAALPSILLLDSAMKNVSERENRELFQAFYSLVFELAAGELKDTQFVLIDKEFFDVPEGIDLKVKSRHMAPGSRDNPPLVPYYNVPQVP